MASDDERKMTPEELARNQQRNSISDESSLDSETFSGNQNSIALDEEIARKLQNDINSVEYESDDSVIPKIPWALPLQLSRLELIMSLTTLKNLLLKA